LSDFDARVFEIAYGRGDAIAYAMVALSMIGSGWAALGLGPLLAWARTRSFAAWLAGVLALQAVVVFMTKLAVGRTRPYLALHVSPLLDAPTDHSFPSGHASGSFALAAFVLATALLSRNEPRRRLWLAVGVLGVVLAFAIGVSRVWLGVHWPSDVAAGACIGTTLGAAGAWARARAGRFSGTRSTAERRSRRWARSDSSPRR
jgi:undecaprenyl-diphosphatase